jgi:hypothetical protein
MKFLTYWVPILAALANAGKVDECAVSLAMSLPLPLDTDRPHREAVSVRLSDLQDVPPATVNAFALRNLFCR